VTLGKVGKKKNHIQKFPVRGEIQWTVLFHPRKRRKNKKKIITQGKGIILSPNTGWAGDAMCRGVKWGRSSAVVD